MTTWAVEVRPIICQEVEADTWEEAKEKLKETFREQPVELDDIADSEIHDVTPPEKKTQELLDRLKRIIEMIERSYTPDSVDIENVSFKDDEFEDDLEEGDLPKHVYADIHTYDGCGGHIIDKDVEYDVEKLLELEKKWNKKKKDEEVKK